MRSRTVRPVSQRSDHRNQNRQRTEQSVRTARPEYASRSDRAGRRRPPKRSALAELIIRLRRRSPEKAGYFDYDMLFIIIFLLCFGLVMLYSTSAYMAETEFENDMFYFSKQAIIGVLGVGVMFLASRIDYHLFGAFSTEIYVLSIILLTLVRTPLGRELNGAARWIRLPGKLTLQPAEVTKIAVILFIACQLCKMGRKAYRMTGILKLLFLGAIAAGCVFVLTENLSTAVIVMAITCILIFVNHPKTRPFVVLVIIVAVLAAIVIMVLASMVADPQSVKDFRLRRIVSWLNPEATASDGSYQLMQGLYAIGAGGFFGKGLGNSTQKMVIPEAQNDMIFVVICEELGIFGVLVILLLFGLLLYRLMFIATNAPDLYGSLITTGIFAHIALQVVLNVAVVTGLLPTTGITLPFVSYGGTSIIFLMAEMGVALGISRKIRLDEIR